MIVNLLEAVFDNFATGCFASWAVAGKCSPEASFQLVGSSCLADLSLVGTGEIAVPYLTSGSGNSKTETIVQIGNS